MISRLGEGAGGSADAEQEQQFGETYALFSEVCQGDATHYPAMRLAVPAGKKFRISRIQFLYFATPAGPFLDPAIHVGAAALVGPTTITSLLDSVSTVCTVGRRLIAGATYTRYIPTDLYNPHRPWCIEIPASTNFGIYGLGAASGSSIIAVHGYELAA